MKSHTNESRRRFLKKTAYVVPTIVALGTFTSPVMAGGPGNSGNPFPGGNGNGTQARSRLQVNKS